MYLKKKSQCKISIEILSKKAGRWDVEALGNAFKLAFLTTIISRLTE